MPLTVAPASPRDPGARALLEASHAWLATLYTAEENHVLSLEALCAPAIRFFVARDGEAVLGTAALALREGYGEVKSMFVDPAARGQGVADALMARLIAEAVATGLPLMRLETGPRNPEAIRLYEKHGFLRCGAFGDYPDVASSVFMERPVPRRAGPGEDLAAVHALLTASFAYMEGVIDPPSSMGRMTLADLTQAAAQKELWVMGTPAFACMILAPRDGALYLGKLAVEGARRGEGIARLMVAQAVARARALGLDAVELQTRIELTRNQATFELLGFRETGRTAHAGYDRPTSITYRLPV